ncbi:hypothetical protein CPB83DRAFT_854537, partial [Crepidotus variabilis]
MTRSDRFRLAPSLDGEQLILIVCKTHWSNPSGIHTVVQALKILPFHAQSSIVPWMRFKLEGFGIKHCWMTSYHFAALLEYDRYLLVWDFQKDEVSMWDYFRSLIGESAGPPTWVHIFDDRLFTFHDSAVVEWEIPPFLPRSRWKDFLSMDPQPKPLNIMHDLEDDKLLALNTTDGAYSPLRILPSSAWNLWSDIPTYLAIFRTRNESPLLLFQFEQDNSSSQTISLRGRTFNQPQSTWIAYNFGKKYFSSPRVCDGSFVFSTCHNDGDVQLHLVPTDPSKQNGGSIKINRLALRGPNIFQSVACPATGRMCVSVFKETQNEIIILEFLDTPIHVQMISWFNAVIWVLRDICNWLYDIGLKRLF